MKSVFLAAPMLLSACVSAGTATAPPPDLIVSYRDLPLETRTGRAELALRVSRAAQRFCAAYDPRAAQAIFDVRLASERRCPGAAARMVAQRARASVRKAWRAGTRGE